MIIRNKVFKKATGYIHLWLGLASGLIVFVVCITAAIWAFSPEIESLTQPYRHVTAQEKSYLMPSQLKVIAQKQLPERKLQRITWSEKDKAAYADFWDREIPYRYTVYMNPYNGKVLKVKDERRSFFSLVIVGHYTLWLGEVGGEIVKWATLIFSLMLISGIILWWPRNKSATSQRFWIKWKEGVKWKRKNYDLHNIPGFYASWIVVFAALTGIIWTFDWASKAEYWLASGGKAKAEYPDPIVRKGSNQKGEFRGIDSLFAMQLSNYANPNLLEMRFPETDSSAITISVYPHERYYDGDDYYFDPYTFKEIPVAAFGKYANANGGEKLARMNYDIHIGNILGFPGRVAMFLATLIAGSLPITGFYIWWGRRFKKNTGKEKGKPSSNGLNTKLAMKRPDLSRQPVLQSLNMKRNRKHNN